MKINYITSMTMMLDVVHRQALGRERVKVGCRHLTLVVLALNTVFFFRVLSASEWDNEDTRRGSEMGR